MRLLVTKMNYFCFYPFRAIPLSISFMSSTTLILRLSTFSYKIIAAVSLAYNSVVYCIFYGTIIYVQNKKLLQQWYRSCLLVQNTTWYWTYFAVWIDDRIKIGQRSLKGVANLLPINRSTLTFLVSHGVNSTHSWAMRVPALQLIFFPPLSLLL